MQSPTSLVKPVDTKPVTELDTKPDTKPDTMATEKKKPIHYPFWFGGSASSMAACVTHPLDLGESESHLVVLYGMFALTSPP